MALILQQQFTAKDLDIIGKATTDRDGNRNILLHPNNVITVNCRFALPRAATTGKGSQLVSCALTYRFISAATGDLVSVAPTITRIAQVNSVAESQTAVTITGTAPAFQLTSVDTNVNRPVSSVAESFDNQVTGQSISYVYSATFTNSTAETELEIGGVEVTYKFVDGGDLTGTTITSAGATFDEDDSGFLFGIDASGGATTITLPDVAAGMVAVARYIVLVAGNQINFSPNATDYITGLGLNTGKTVDKDYILATPVIGDTITFISNGNATGAWHVAQAFGTFTREV